MEDEKKKNSSRIGPALAILMIFLGLIIDGIQALLTLLVVGLVLNWIVSFFAWLLFYIILKPRGISMSDAKGGKILLSLGAAVGIELIPLLNALPAWTAFAILTVIFENASSAPVVGKVLNKAVPAASLAKPVKA